MTKPLEQAMRELEEQDRIERESRRTKGPSMSEKKEKRDSVFSKLNIKRALKRIVVLVFLTVVVIASVNALSFYLEGDKKGGLLSKSVIDTRECEIKFPGSERALKGTRSYSYRYSEFNGWRWYNTSEVVEETRLSIEGTPLTIIGGNAHEPADKTWVKNIEQGERYSQLIENKQRYTLILGDSKKVSTTVDYRDMCK